MMVSGALGAPADYIGAIACGKCHPAQFAGQSKGGHSLALRRAPDHPLAKAYMASPDWKRGTTYQFVFSRRSDGFFVQAFDYAARQNMELPIEWAFGAGNHAVTFVSRVTGEVYLEHAMHVVGRTLGRAQQRHTRQNTMSVADIMTD